MGFFFLLAEARISRRTVFVVENNAITDINIAPIEPSTAEATSAKGACDAPRASQPSIAMDAIATSM